MLIPPMALTNPPFQAQLEMLASSSGNVNPVNPTPVESLEFPVNNWHVIVSVVTILFFLGEP